MEDETPDITDTGIRRPQEEQDGLLAGKVLELLKGVSNTRASNILKMVGARYNLRFVSSYAPAGPTGKIPLTGETRFQNKPRVAPKRADPKVKAIRSQIKQANLQISKKSVELGRRLQPDDPELVARDECFRRLKDAENTLATPAKTGAAKSQETSSLSDELY